MGVFDSRERAQIWVDPHNEYVWEEKPSPEMDSPAAEIKCVRHRCRWTSING